VVAPGSLYLPVVHQRQTLHPETGRSDEIFDADAEIYLSESTDETIFAADTTAAVVAVDRDDGTARWKRDLRPDAKRIFASPVVSGDTVYVSTREYVYALDAARGDTRWRSKPGGTYHFRDPPTVADGTLYVGRRGTGRFYALDAATGDVLWSTELGGVRGKAAVTSDSVYVNTAGLEDGPDGSLHALDRETGTVTWSADPDGIGGPVVDGETVYLGIDGPGAVALDVATGRERWRVSKGTQTATTATLADDTVFVGGSSTVRAFATDDGDIRWSFDGARNVLQAPAVTGDAVYVGDGDGSDEDGRLYALRRRVQH
jgi:outer membrane protein assembly factor BamB